MGSLRGELVLGCLGSFEPVLWRCGLAFSFRFWVGLFRGGCCGDLLLVYFGGYLGINWLVLDLVVVVLV